MPSIPLLRPHFTTSPLSQLQLSLEQILEKAVTESEGIPAPAPRVTAMNVPTDATLATLAGDSVEMLAAQERLGLLLRGSMSRPIALLRLFQEFTELAEIDEKKYLAGLKEQLKKPARAYAGVLERSTIGE